MSRKINWQKYRRKEDARRNLEHDYDACIERSHGRYADKILVGMPKRKKRDYETLIRMAGGVPKC